SSTTRTCLSAMSAPSLDRQREHEAAALSGLALDPDAAAVEFDQALREREPEPCALPLIDPDIGLLELLEDPVVILGRDSRPGVRDCHPHLAVHPGRDRKSVV